MTSTRMVGCLFSQLTEGQVEWSPLEQELDIVRIHYHTWFSLTTLLLTDVLGYV